MHIQLTDSLSLSDSRLHDLFERALSELSIATHTGEGSLYDLVSELLQQARRSDLPSAAQDEKRL